LGRCNTFFEEYWQYVLKQNVIRVPEGCSTINEAMDLAVVFSERNECTRENPVKVEVGEGEHVMVGVERDDIYDGRMTIVSCSNIAIVGKGKSKSTMIGGLYVDGKQNVKIEQLSATNAAGFGLICGGSGANVDVTECCFNKCLLSGMAVFKGATVTATRCEFMENVQVGVDCDGANTKVRLNDSTMHHNRLFGLAAGDDAVVDLHGTKTDIHSNTYSGIHAHQNGQVNIHLPSQHNTTHDNRTDRFQSGGGSIANINADGTFTHVH
jgi:hypothetical protein